MNKAFLFISLIFITAFMVACKDNEKKEIKTPVAENEKNARKGSKTILFFGNSLTAGYGLEPTQSFPSLIQNKIDSANLGYTVVNAGVSGETSAGGNSRINWILKQPLDVFVLELGAND